MPRVAFWEIYVLVALVVLPGSCWAWSGKVVGISDGDTITVLRTGRSQVKVRLHGIDAPESEPDVQQRGGSIWISLLA
jgi:endonuclease YncB( thermonuclease family)